MQIITKLNYSENYKMMCRVIYYKNEILSMKIKLSFLVIGIFISPLSHAMYDALPRRETLSQQQKVTLYDATGTEYTISSAAARHAGKLKRVLEATINNNIPLSLPHIAPPVIQRLIERLIFLAQPYGKETIKHYFKEMVHNMPLEELQNDAQAAQYIEAQELLELTAKAIAYKLVASHHSWRWWAQHICTINNQHVRSLVRKMLIQHLKKTTPWEIKNILNPHSLKAITSITFSADKKKMITNASRSAYIWDTRSYEQIGRLRDPRPRPGSINSAAFAPDDTIIATGSDDNIVRLWDASTYIPFGQLCGHTGSIKALTFLPDGKIITGSEDGMVYIWDVHATKKIGELPHPEALCCLASSPDGTKIATGSIDGMGRIWDAHTYKLIVELYGHNGALNSIAFSPNGQFIATGSDDTLTLLWDAETYASLAILADHLLPVRAVAFSPNSREIISASEDTFFCIWDTATYKKINQGNDGTDPLVSIAFSPDGENIITGTGGRDIIIYIWHHPTAEAFRKKSHHVQKACKQTLPPAPVEERKEEQNRPAKSQCCIIH